jgi:sporulation protein YqfC
MGKGRNYFENMITKTSLTMEAVSWQPVVEIVGDKRVLVECHQGVLAYSKEQIRVKVRYGCLCICGCSLEMLHMSKEKLIISGRIDSVQLLRRECI